MFALVNSLAAAGFTPSTLLSNMLKAVKAAGGAAWYVADDYLTLGPELSPNPGAPFTDTTGITPFTSGVLSVVNGMLRSGTSAGAAQPMIANFAIATTVGKTYRISVPRATKTANVMGLFLLQASVNANGSSPFGSISFGAAGAGSYGLMEYVFTATAATTYVGLRADNGVYGTSSDYSEWGGCSVREVLSAKDWQDSAGTLPSYLGGTVGKANDIAGSQHATQATAGNRPIISRIPRKLGPELVVNGGFDSAASWTDASSSPATTSISGGIATLTGDGTNMARLRQLVPLIIGKTYAVTTKMMGSNSVDITIGSTLGGFQQLSSAAPSSAISTSTFTATDVNGYLQLGRTPSGSATVDSTSVREVLEWSYALTFDGTNDSLAAPASMIGANPQQPYTMIAWGRPASINATRRVVGDNLRQLGIDAAGHTYLLHNTTGSKAGTYTHIAGQPGIIEAAWDGVNVDLRTNGVTDGSGALAAPGGTLYATCIGQGGAGSSFWAGEVGGVVVCPAVMTDAQRLAVRKFAAAQMGLTL